MIKDWINSNLFMCQSIISIYGVDFKLAKAHVKVQKSCLSAMNRWKFLISARDMINNYSNRIDSNDGAETTEKTNSR